MPYNILIVDDEAVITNGLAYDIDWSRIGVLEVFKANDVPTALEYLRNNRIDVVITDIRMPEMDGLELAGRIRQQWHFAKTIFISGYDEFEYAQKAIDLGVFSYITKPIPNERLMETVARAFRAIDAELDNTRLMSRALREHAESPTMIRERELSLWIAGGGAAPDAEALERMGISLGPELFLTLVTVDSGGSAVQAGAHGHETVLQGMVDSILHAGRGQARQFLDEHGNTVVVSGLGQRDDLRDTLRFMQGMAEPFQSSVSKATGLVVSLFFGNIVPAEQVHDEYMRLLKQLASCAAGEPGVIMLPEPQPSAVEEAKPGAQAVRLSRLVEQVSDYVQQNMHKEITVADIAAHLHLHPNYLLRLFKEQTGDAVIDFLIQARIHRAKDLLKDPNRKIYEVAESVGYDSVAHFSRIFKRETGLSPKEYQQSK